MQFVNNLTGKAVDFEYKTFYNSTKMKNFWILQKGVRPNSSSNINYICFYLESFANDKSPILKIDNQYKAKTETNGHVRLYVMIKSNSLKNNEMIIRYFGHVSVLKNSINMIYFQNFIRGNELQNYKKHFNSESKEENKQEENKNFGKIN